jgi:uncharacterized protein
MTSIAFLTAVIIGIGVGFFTGTFGLGGGLLLVPALVYFLGINQQTAQGTSIAIMLLPIGLFAFWNYHKSGHVNIRIAIIIAIAFMAGSFFGSKVSLGIPEPAMRKAFGIVLAIIAVKMILLK